VLVYLVVCVNMLPSNTFGDTLHFCRVYIMCRQQVVVTKGLELVTGNAIANHTLMATYLVGGLVAYELLMTHRSRLWRPLLHHVVATHAWNV